MVVGRINEVVISTIFSDKKLTDLLSGPKLGLKYEVVVLRCCRKARFHCILKINLLPIVMKLRRSWGQFCISCSFTGTSHRFAL